MPIVESAGTVPFAEGNRPAHGTGRMEYYGELVICLCEEMKEKEANDYEIMDGYMCFDKEERRRICWSDKVL
ncbi:hypothetical protein Tco_1231847, partial [Tanacetum coccineum]